MTCPHCGRVARAVLLHQAAHQLITLDEFTRRYASIDTTKGHPAPVFTSITDAIKATRKAGRP